MDLKIGDILKPWKVTVHRADNVMGINYFKARMVSKGVSEIHKILNCTNKFYIDTNPEILNMYVANINSQYKIVKLIKHEVSYNEVILMD